jgi:lipoprotein-anchoring transpeptidase ErfK/SrfK
MSRFATSLLSTTGLLLITVLAILPTKIHAQTTLPKAIEATPPTAIAPKAPTTLVPAIVKPVTGASISTPIPAAATGKSISTPIQAATTGASISTPNKPATTNSIPAAGQNAPAKPAVTAATSQPPVADTVNLILKLKERKVYVYKGDKVVANYPVAVGKKGWETPTGDWYVMEKIVNPGWTSFKNGQVTKPGPKNPLGERWIGFWTDGQDVIGFHGTPSVKSIGTAASHGCVRMFDKDVKELFPLVTIGTTVKVVNE